MTAPAPGFILPAGLAHGPEAGEDVELSRNGAPRVRGIAHRSRSDSHGIGLGIQRGTFAL